jgi:hypothetical protein
MQGAFEGVDAQNSRSSRVSGNRSNAISSQPIPLQSLSRRALKRPMHFLEQSGVHHE